MDEAHRAQLEQRIAHRLEARDLRGAADQALRGYGAEVASYLRAVLRDEVSADEVFARVCEKLWRGLSTFRRQSTLRTWLYRLAWNAARDFEKEAARNPVRALRTTEISRIPAETSASRPSLSTSAAADVLAKLREGLDAKDQTLLTLRISAGLSWTEVAEVVGAGPAVLRKRFERLKARLRKEIDSAGHPDLGRLVGEGRRASRRPARQTSR